MQNQLRYLYSYQITMPVTTKANLNLKEDIGPELETCKSQDTSEYF